MPAAEACAAMLLAIVAAANDVPVDESPAPPPEMLMYLAEFDSDPVAVDAAMKREDDAPAAVNEPRRDEHEDADDDDDAPR